MVGDHASVQTKAIKIQTPARVARSSSSSSWGGTRGGIIGGERGSYGIEERGGEP